MSTGEEVLSLQSLIVKSACECVAALKLADWLADGAALSHVFPELWFVS